MKRFSTAAVTLSVVVLLALSACGSGDSSDSDGSTASSEPSKSAAEAETTDAASVCLEVGTEVGRLSQQALEDIDDEEKSTEAYDEMAKVYENGAGKLDEQEAKDIFQELADISREIATGGSSAVDSERLNKAVNDLGKVCSGR